LGFGIGLSALREGIDNSITTVDQIKAISGVPVLSSISFIVTDRERRLVRLKKLSWVVILFMVVGAVLYGINRYFMNLDELWTLILDRLKMIA
jgi:hypothetical protein